MRKPELPRNFDPPFTVAHHLSGAWVDTGCELVVNCGKTKNSERWAKIIVVALNLAYPVKPKRRKRQ